MQFVNIIEKKADGLELTEEEIRYMITGYTSGDIPDYQMASMCMAILQK
jgi:pyrimidine-nucleoside phosphorylase